jgi:undecaprenyl diphosphate synthase
MDGNGRWAESRGRPRGDGHLAGAEAVRRSVEAALDLGVGTLTLYAFSADNWKRPAEETRKLMALFRQYLAETTIECIQTGVRINVVGRRDRLEPSLRQAIEAAETATRPGRRLMLRLAIDYSARGVYLEAARLMRDDGGEPSFDQALAGATHDAESVPDVDLLIRTGGEQRLSDLFGWECAYAEVLFLPKMWPDLSAEDLASAIGDFRARERRFGGLPGAAAAVPQDPASLAACTGSQLIRKEKRS